MKTLKLNFTITASIYFVVYVAKTFCIWQFTNPFQWIINMPEYTASDRFCILSAAAFYYGTMNVIIYENNKTKL
jgi:hypothetical protein